MPVSYYNILLRRLRNYIKFSHRIVKENTSLESRRLKLTALLIQLLLLYTRIYIFVPHCKGWQWEAYGASVSIRFATDAAAYDTFSSVMVWCLLHFFSFLLSAIRVTAPLFVLLQLQAAHSIEEVAEILGNTSAYLVCDPMRRIQM
jgi:hypothetical protein